jgi:hypothetical protein
MSLALDAAYAGKPILLAKHQRRSQSVIAQANVWRMVAPPNIPQNLVISLGLAGPHKANPLTNFRRLGFILERASTMMGSGD